jgi:integrase
VRSTVRRTVARDLQTRWEGVYIRHRKGCQAPDGRRCTCEPGYMARVWDRARGEQLRSTTFRSAAAARAWRSDTLDKLARGEMPDVRSALRLGKAVERFVEAARDGSVLTKHGRRYKPTAVADMESALLVHVVPELGTKRISDVRRGDVQRLVDDLAPRLSGSRVRSVVNATRSLYRWAQDRDHVGHNPAALVRLPAMNAKARERVAAPPELEQLLAALEAPDRVPFALAAYATARRQEIRLVRWADVDLDAPAVRLGADSAGRKSDAALRLVPLVRPLRALLRAEWVRQGQPAGHQLVCPPLKPRGPASLLSIDGVHTRAFDAWEDAGLAPILLQECRHTAASWLNAAGVNPKVASQIMGHETLARAAAAAAGAAQITLGRYTHTLPGDLERARELLDAYLDEALKTARETGS